jgi:hypothetical protein
MYLGFYNFYKSYNGNRMFTDPSSPIGDNLGYPMVHLGQRLRALGHRVATLDMDDLSKFDVAVFLDHPTFLNPYLRRLKQMKGKKRYLFLLENIANRPDNYWLRNHEAFDGVFTWNPELVDGRKYHRFHLANQIPPLVKFDPQEKRKFCVTIASQKYSSHPQEIYSERVRAIRWFEANHPADFDLYGTLWEQPYFTGKLARLNLGLQQFYARFPGALRRRRFPSHRGTVPSKRAVLRQYKFAICYENAVFPGYITEKIFDALFAGCIPIYLGAPDVTEQLPKNIFIDKRQFKTYADLYDYLHGMPAAEYLGYRQAIEQFLTGPGIRPFGAEYFADTVIQHIVNAEAAT